MDNTEAIYQALKPDFAANLKEVNGLQREIVTPKDEQHWHEMRSKVITSTDVAALFGISPYLSAYELWHRKKNVQVVALEPNQRMLWGNRLEKAIAEGIAEDCNFNVRPMKEFIQIPTWRMGSSFDYAIGDDGILEVKNVDSLAYKDGWLISGDQVEAPSHIELQLQFQMLVSGRTHGSIGALIGGNRVVLISREADLQIHESIKAKVAEFWESIDANREPHPDFKVDAEFISKINGFAEPGKIMNDGGGLLKDLVTSYKKWGTAESNAKEEKEGIKAQILTIIQDAEKVLGDGYTISASVTPPTLIEAYTRKAFRNFRIFIKGAKS